MSTIKSKYDVVILGTGHNGEPEFAALKRVFRDQHVYAGVGSVVDLPAAIVTPTGGKGQ